MKRRFWLVLFLAVCLLCLGSGRAKVASAVTIDGVQVFPAGENIYDEDENFRYSLYREDASGRCSIRFNVSSASWILENDVLGTLYAENDFVYVEMYVTQENQVIPKEILNQMAENNGLGYIFVQVEDSWYDWGIATHSGTSLKKDFSPYITFSTPESYAGAYPEGTDYLLLETGYDEEISQFIHMLSLTYFAVGNEMTWSGRYFHDFFQTYCVEDIKKENGIFLEYSYLIYREMTGKEYPQDMRGKFSVTEFDEEGKVNQQWNEEMWRYVKIGEDGTLDYAHVELRSLAKLTGGTFVVSDQACSGSIPREELGSDSSNGTADDASQSGDGTGQNSTGDGEKSGTGNQSAEAVQGTANQSAEAVQGTGNQSAEVVPEKSCLLYKLQGKCTGDKKISLTWKGTAPQGAVSIAVYRKVKGTKKYRKIATLPVTARKYVDKSLRRGKKYIYRLVCLNNRGKKIAGTSISTQKIKVPYLATPKIKMKVVRYGDKPYLQVTLKKYAGKYIEIYLSQNGKDYKKVTLNNISISRYGGKFLLRSKKSMGLIYGKVRTWKRIKGKKECSMYSKVKKVRLS